MEKNKGQEPSSTHRNTTKTSSLGTGNWRTLQYFNVYRFALSGLATSAAIFAGQIHPFGSSEPDLFFFSSITYLAISLFAIQITRLRQPDLETQASVFTFADITFLSLLISSSGGLDSGLGLLLIIAIAVNSLLLGRKMIIFYASLATIAIWLIHAWPWLTGIASSGSVFDKVSQVGMLGVGLFFTATAGNALALRLRNTEALALKRGERIVGLTQLNEFIVRKLQSGVLVCNTQGQIGMINEAAQRFLGIEEEPGRKKTLSLAQIAPEMAGTLHEWLKNPQQAMQKPMRSRAGFVVISRFELLSSDPQSGILIFMDDMTLLKQQAQQLKMAALARLTASIAHEIRNPLGAISNAAQLLAESTPSESPDLRLVQIIEDHCRRMNTIIENITQLARRDRVNRSEVHLKSWLEEFKEQFIELIGWPDAAVSVECNEELTACTDPDQLYQIVINLCQNATRYCPEFDGNNALIRLLANQTEDGRPYLDVTDRGSGVPPEIAENIFDPFFTTAAKGTGLGLYISRELCEGSGGSLDYHPGQEKGACFRVTLAHVSECESG